MASTVETIINKDSTTETLISRDSKPDEYFNLIFCCRNIANAARDESMKPLYGRLDQLIEDLKWYPDGMARPDVFVALEAGRPSQGHSWTEMASRIESETGLRYEHCSRLNATPNAFGKALFINPSRVAISKVQQLWTSQDEIHLWGGDYFGNDILLVYAHPVVDGKVIMDKEVRAAFVHFPMKHAERIRVAQWITSHQDLADLWMGNFNTFSDDLCVCLLAAI